MTPPPSVVRIDRSVAISGSLRCPGSKSYTNRVLLMAGLADGTSRISNGLAGGDADSMVSGLRLLGVEITDESVPGAAGNWTVGGNAGVLPDRPVVIDAELAGTTLRFLSAVSVLGPAGVTVTARGSLLTRPMGPLLTALRGCGATIEGSGPLGECAPVVSHPRSGRLGGRVTLDASQSSQFVTALLLVAPYFDDDLVLDHHGLGAHGFVDLTIDLMAAHGVTVSETADGLRVPAGSAYRASDERVPPDASAASHLFTLATATGGVVTVEDLEEAESQPDYAILGVLEEFGAAVTRDPRGAVTVTGPAHLRPVDVDLRSMPDQLPNIAVLAALAPGVSHIGGVGITRFHETDRIAAVTAELAKAGITVEAGDDEVIVHGGSPLVAATFWAHHDHRMAMALAALAAVVDGSHIEGADAVAKTYGAFWSDVATLGLHWMPI